MELTEQDRRMLLIAATDLDDYAGVLKETGDVGVIQLAMALRELAAR